MRPGTESHTVSLTYEVRIYRLQEMSRAGAPEVGSSRVFAIVLPAPFAGFMRVTRVTDQAAYRSSPYLVLNLIFHYSE